MYLIFPLHDDKCHIEQNFWYQFLPSIFESSSSSSSSEESISRSDEEDCESASNSYDPQLFTQSELNDLVRYLGLRKDTAELRCSRLHVKNLLSQMTSYSFYCDREKEFMLYFVSDAGLALL